MQRRPGNAPRPRPPRACVRCAERKVSCDKARPKCNRCLQARLECRYAGFGPSTGTDLIIIDETQSVREQMSLPNRMDRLGHMILDTHTGGGAGTSEWEEGDAAGDAPESTCTDDEEEDSVEPVRTANDSDPGHLSLGAQTKSSYLSPSYFAAISQEINEINELLRKQKRHGLIRLPGLRYSTMSNSSAQSTCTVSSDSHRSFAAGSRQLYGDIFTAMPLQFWNADMAHLSPQNLSTAELVEALPTSEHCEILIRAYFKGYHTMKPLFNGLAFLNEVRELQLWRAGSRPNYVLGTHFLAVYSAVIFAGCVVCPRSTISQYFGSLSREALSHRFYGYAICATRLAEFPTSPSLWTFAAFIIINSTWLKEEQPLVCSAFIGLAFRVAQMLGLHREPSQFDNVEPADVQVRRQLWWTTVALDAQIALASGLPPMIESKFYNVSPVSEKDALDVSSNAQRTILGIFVGGRYNFYRQTSDFLRLLNSSRVTKHDVDEMLKIARYIGKDMARRREMILEQSQNAQEPLAGRPNLHDDLRRAQSNPVLASFAMSVLSMLAAKPFAFMYGPLRRHDLLPYLREKEPDFIAHCRYYLHQFLKLAQNQDFQPWHWCWPGQHQPLHSILALIADLEQFPNDPLANETRKLVDLGLLMSESSHKNGISSSDEGLVDYRPPGDEGFEAWDFIRQARDHVWEKAGFDPAVLRCPESAGEINFDSPSEADSIQALDMAVAGQHASLAAPDHAEWSMYTDIADPNWAQDFISDLPFEDLDLFNF